MSQASGSCHWLKLPVDFDFWFFWVATSDSDSYLDVDVDDDVEVDVENCSPYAGRHTMIDRDAVVIARDEPD